MRVTYIRLDNVAGLLAGSDRDSLEISFDQAMNKIISIQGRNGIGKTVLISSIHPFSYVTSLDERSTLPYIKRGKDGYKEIHYIDGDDTYVIKHYFKATKDTHSVKSYFIKNGTELNESGNVSSFNALVETHFGLTQEMMRLIRIGTNVNSFISLTPAKRKEYIGKLIDEINGFLMVYKKVTEDIRVVKALVQVNSTNLYNCHITDIVVEEDKLDKITHDIKKRSSERDKIVSKIAKIKTLMQSNDIDQLRQRYQELDSAIKEFLKVEESSKSLGNVTMDDLMKKRNLASSELLDAKSQVNSYRMMIDTMMARLDKLEVTIQKISSEHDLHTLMNTIQELKQNIAGVSPYVRDFQVKNAHYDDVADVIAKLRSLNQIGQMILSLGKKPLEIYLKLRKDNMNIDKWLTDQAKRNISRINQSDVRSLMDQVFQGETIITPNCVTEFNDCPYYRFSELVTKIYDDMSKDVIDDETLRYIRVIHNNTMTVENELFGIRDVVLPEYVKASLTIDTAIDRIKTSYSFFDLGPIMEFSTIVKEYELYASWLKQLAQYEDQVAIYQKAGVEAQLQEKDSITEQIKDLRNKLQTAMDDVKRAESKMDQIDSEILLITKRDEARRNHSVYSSELKSIKSKLEPLEHANDERRELEYELKQLTSTLEMMRGQERALQNKIAEYHKLVDERVKLDQMNKDLTSIQLSVGTKKGIPVFYMKNYLQRIQTMANDLLNLIYQGDFQLANFNVTPDTFEVPYVKNGWKLPDIKYASQSELALATMALSFALSHKASAHYNILLLDEIDAGLDEHNRASFMRMLYMQMDMIHAEQVFIISHNLSQMINVPMDAIRLSDTDVKSKLQNVIFE